MQNHVSHSKSQEILMNKEFCLIQHKQGAAMPVLEILLNKKSDESKRVSNFQNVLVLSIAYACSIGKLGTLIRTAPNALFAALMLEYYCIEFSCVQWTGIGVAVVILVVP